MAGICPVAGMGPAHLARDARAHPAEALRPRCRTFSERNRAERRLTSLMECRLMNNKLVLTGFFALASIIGLGGLARADQPQALRGAAVDEPVAVDTSLQWEERKGRIQRNYRQQPPLIPHSVDQYQIDLRVNQCLSCHDWSKAGERNAPTLSMTHYLDRDGRETDRIAGSRYFCNQCHVPQADTPALVDNVFQPSFAR